MRKRALRGAVVVTLAVGLSLFATPVAGAPEAPPEKAAISLWAGIEAWFQDLLADWLGPKTVEAIYQADTQETPQTPTGTDSQDGGSGGTTTTDTGPGTDPDG